MLRDLLRDEASDSDEYDVAIVGAGIAGLLLANRLRDRKLKVAILESGDRHQPSLEHPLNEVEQVGVPYRGASMGRFRCLGGTSTRWGGALIPFLPSDFEARDHYNVAKWPATFGDIAPYVQEAERFFHVDSSPYEEPAARQLFLGKKQPSSDSEILVRFAKWPKFVKRNVASALKARIHGDKALTIWLNASVTAIELDPNRRHVSQIVVRAPNAKTLRIAAKWFVLCAGAIESTRLLLMLNRSFGDQIFPAQQELGRNLHDHISLPAASINARDPKRLNMIAGFRFLNGFMRSPRFEITSAVQRKDGVGAGFAHIAAHSTEPSGFDDLRSFMRSVQQWQPEFGKAAAAAGDLGYLFQAAEWRLLRQRLRWPLKANFEVQLVVEQEPNPNSRIGLSSRTDSLGCPLAVIDWKISGADVRTVGSLAQRFGAFWSRAGLDDVGELEWRVPLKSLSIDDVSRGSDIFHPGGTTRMGSNASTSVLDGNLSTHALPNLAVASTSAFPSGASSNPTMTLIAFSLRLGDRIAADLSRSGAS